MNNFQNYSIKLTSREKEILELTANEFTCKEIASTLFISLPTVETHRRNLFSKLDVRNVAGLIRRSFEVGFLSVPNHNRHSGNSRYKQTGNNLAFG